MNSVGMAMQILDTMSDSSEKNLRSETKAELVKLLIKQVTSEKASSPDKPRALRLEAVYKPEDRVFWVYGGSFAGAGRSDIGGGRRESS
jgi:hypothetical protein